MKKIKTRDIVLILIIIALAAVLLVVGLQSRKSASSVKTAAEETAAVEASPAESTEAPVAEASPEVTAETAETEAADDTASAEEQARAYLDEYPAEAYLVITTSNGTYTPIPLNEEGSFKINFSNGEYNVIHIGKNSFYMESSTCDNQNCVGEGEVTLENRDTRALYDMVLCLPHNLTLQLVDADEALTMLTEMMAYGTSESAGTEAEPTAEPAEGANANAA